MWAFVLLVLFGALIGYACCVVAGREDERTEAKWQKKRKMSRAQNSVSTLAAFVVYLSKERMYS